MNEIPKFTRIQPRPDGPPKPFVFPVVWYQGWRSDKTGLVTTKPGWYIPEPNEGETLEVVINELRDDPESLHSLWEFDPVAGTIRQVQPDTDENLHWYRG